MLIISRKKQQKLIIADQIEITILETGRNRVRFGIKAPKHIHIQTHMKNDPLPVQDPSDGPSERMDDQPSPLQDITLAVGSIKRV